MATSSFQPIVLRDYQVPHFNKMMATLDKQFFSVDGSEMGLGKTIVSLEIAKKRSLTIVVVAPVAARSVWMTEINKYGVASFNIDNGPILTYEGLRGTRAHPPRHGMLDRRDIDVINEGRATTVTTFTSTPRLNAMIDHGTLFVFDEFHKIKNTSGQTEAARAIISAIYARGGRSRFILTSGTAMDKSEQVITFLRSIMFIRHRSLYTLNNGVVKPTGLAELNDWALRIAPEEAKFFIATKMYPVPRTRKMAEQYVVELFLQVIKPHIMSIMIRPADKKTNKDIKNGYYKLEDAQNAPYREGILSLAKAVRYDPASGQIVRAKATMGDVTKALMQIQQAKCSAMARVAKKLLNEKDSNGLYRKVILSADYHECIDELMNELRDYNPLELTGRIAQGKRPAIVELFQQQNLNYRLLIANPEVGGVAISLHDLTGQFPRYMLIMPGYRINELHQATGRIYRDGVQGTATIRFFYGLGGETESNILSALMRKGEFMSKLLEEQTEGGMVFPNKYETETEEGVSVKLMNDILSSQLSVELPSDIERGDFEHSESIADSDPE